MRNLAMSAYEATPIKAVGVMKPDSDLGETIEGFQAVILEAERMANSGLISITLVHHESTSGHRLIDLIRFTRLK
jgi:hypothetical protein